MAQRVKQEFLAGYLYMMITLSFQQMEFRERKEIGYDTLLPELLAYLEENISNELLLDKIAETLGLNSS